MREGWLKRKFGDLVVFDKRFNGLSSQQTTVCNFPHVSAEKLKELRISESSGDVRLLSTGYFDGYTSIELAGENLCDSEVISIPSGGNPNIKYHKGLFVDSGNILCKSINETVYLKFVFYNLLSKLDIIKSYFRGASILHPQMKDIYNINLLLPSISLQNKIVAELDLLSHILDQKRQQLKEYDALAESIFYDMFGDPVENPKGWEVKKLGDFCMLSQGLAINKQTKHLIVEYSSIPLLRIKDMKEGTREIFVDEINYPPNCLATEDEIIYTRTGTLGLAFTGMFGIVHNNCFKIKINDLVDKVYFMNIIMQSHFRNNIISQASRSSQPDITHKLFLAQKIILPPLSLQQSFASKIEAIEKQKLMLKESIKETETLFQSRMDYWFNA